MKFYRYVEVNYESGPSLFINDYELLRETPKGYWIIDTIWEHHESVEIYKKWVSKTARKRFAYPTKKEALENFKARKQRQIHILTYQLSDAKKALMLAEAKDSTEVCFFESKRNFMISGWNSQENIGEENV